MKEQLLLMIFIVFSFCYFAFLLTISKKVTILFFNALSVFWPYKGF